MMQPQTVMDMNEPRRTDEPTPEWIERDDSPLRDVHRHLHDDAAKFFGYDTIEVTGLRSSMVTEQGVWRLSNGSSGPWAAMHCPTRTVYVYEWGSKDVEAAADTLGELTSPEFTAVACTEEVCRDEERELSTRRGSSPRQKPRVVGGTPDDLPLDRHLLMGDVPDPTYFGASGVPTYKSQIHLPNPSE